MKVQIVLKKFPKETWLDIEGNAKEVERLVATIKKYAQKHEREVT